MQNENIHGSKFILVKMLKNKLELSKENYINELIKKKHEKFSKL